MRVLLLCGVVCQSAICLAAEPAVDYFRDIKPLLQTRCYACHGALQQKNGLRVDTVAFLKRGGSLGPAIEPGRGAESILVEAVSGADGVPKMPPKGEGTSLTKEQVALLKRWIDSGAPAPVEKIPEDPRRHWAFQKPIRPAVPAVQHREYVANPVDAFLVREWEQHGLTPAPLADKATLLRRVSIDLVGLPPTRAEQQEFLADLSPGAYERWVDRLLASPQYAERWGRHWMDIWRYSDWYGRREINEQRNSRRHIWRWRDWIVDSLAADKGYDVMLREMLAADELAPGDLDAQRASGYLGRSYFIFNRSVWLQDTVEHVGVGFLGLTLKCCRCHDHKYDPISQVEYYRLRNIFEPYLVRTDRIPGHSAEYDRGLPQTKEYAAPGAMLKNGYDCIYDGNPTAVTHLLRRGNDKDPDLERKIFPGVPAVLGGRELEVRPVELPLEAFYPLLRPGMREELLAQAEYAVRQGERKLVELRKQLATAKRVPPTLPAGAEATATAAKSPPSPAEVQRLEWAVQWQTQRIAGLKQDVAALSARIAAELAKYARPANPQYPSLARRAAELEQDALLQHARVSLAEAEADWRAAKAVLQPRIVPTLRAFEKAEKIRTVAQREAAAAEEAVKARNSNYTPLGLVYPQTSSGRRAAFARWLTSPENPLTARVAVNHIWARHFGAGLVASLNNFGLNGKRPTHPELLDWLACELMRPTGQPWRMKHVHRLLVTSLAYQRSSLETEVATETRQKDPENRWLCRMNPRRMEAEVVRDSLLQLGGNLDLKRGGPDLDPALADSAPRRSLYFTVCPDTSLLMLNLFDVANPLECYQRTESIIPQQALALSNSALSLAQARLIARQLAPPGSGGQAEPLEENEFVNQACRQLLCRLPDPAERRHCLDFLRSQTALLSRPAELRSFPAGPAATVLPATDPRQRARENLIHVLLNYNEFVMVR